MHWDKERGKWVASIRNGSGKVFLGRYKSFKDAARSRLEAEESLNWTSCDPKSPAFEYVNNLELGR